MHSSAAVTGRWQCSVCHRARPGAIFFLKPVIKHRNRFFSVCINHLNLYNLNVRCINYFSWINENETCPLYWKVQAQYYLYDTISMILILILDHLSDYRIGEALGYKFEVFVW